MAESVLSVMAGGGHVTGTELPWAAMSPSIWPPYLNLTHQFFNLSGRFYSSSHHQVLLSGGAGEQEDFVTGAEPHLGHEESPHSNFSVFFSNRTCPLDIRSLDFSLYEYQYRKETWKPVGTEEVVKIVFYVLIFLISLVGNTLVILVVYYNTHMRTSTNQYLVNLAVADLLVTLCCTWVHLVRHLSHPNYVLPAVVCKMEGFIVASTLTASVLTLTVISVGRFVAVIFPLHARTSASHANRVIVLIWLLSILIASPTILYREMYDIQWLDFTLWQCDEFWPIEGQIDPTLKRCVITYDSKKNFYTIFTVSLYFIPVTVMLLSYSLVVWRLWVTKLPGEHSQPARLTVTRSKKKVVKMVTFVLLAFVLCWTPLQSLILYSNFFHSGEELPDWFPKVEYASYFVAHANSALNPILYCSFNAGFRQGLSSLVHCQGSARGRMHHRRLNWKGMTAGTRETTFGVSGNAEPVVLLEFSSTKRNRTVSRSNVGGSSESSPCLNRSGRIFRSNPPSPNVQQNKLYSQSSFVNSTSPSVRLRMSENATEIRPNSLSRKSSLQTKVSLGGMSSSSVNSVSEGGCCGCCKNKEEKTMKNRLRTSEEVFRIKFSKNTRASSEEHML